VKVVVFGYQEIGCVCLETLIRRGVEIRALVTHEDDPSENVWFRSTAAIARARGISVYETADVSDPRWADITARAKPDIIFSFMFRKMIPEAVLKTAPRGAFNLHPSHLPKYRGRCPANWAIINGEAETGLTLHEMTKRADAGAIVAQVKIPIAQNDDIAELYRKMAREAGPLLANALPSIESGNYPRIAQDEGAATKFGGRKPGDGKFSWDWPARRIHDLVRGVTHPYPGAFFECGTERIFVWKTAIPGADAGSGEPGRILSRSPLVAATGEGGALEVLRIQSEGHPEIDGAKFASASAEFINRD